MARPIEWTQDKKEKAIEIIFTEMAQGKSLRQILNQDNENMPSRKLFYEWVAKDKELSDHYAKVMDLRSDVLFDEMIDIADDTSNDTVYTETGEKANSEWINRSRLRVDTRKWILSKMNPKKYGDKTDITTNGRDIGSKYSDWTDEQIALEVERIKNK
jgi:hypothetical protein